MRFWKSSDRPVEAHAGPTEADLKAAYERGRADERKRHKSHPILSLLVLAVAVVGGGMIYLAAREGSFTQAGQVADTKLAAATGQVGPNGDPASQIDYGAPASAGQASSQAVGG